MFLSDEERGRVGGKGLTGPSAALDSRFQDSVEIFLPSTPPHTHTTLVLGDGTQGLAGMLGKQIPLKFFVG